MVTLVSQTVKSHYMMSIVTAFSRGPQLGVGHWAHKSLSEPEVIEIARFSGIFALFEISLSYGQYWVTAPLANVSL
jgi:hypothetical protein